MAGDSPEVLVAAEGRVGAPDLLVRRIFLSALALVYLAAFLSLWVQIHGLAGSDGIAPAEELLSSVEKQLGRGRFYRLPTLGWLVGAGDTALHLLCAAGTGAALLLFAGVAPAATCALAWMIYLSVYTLCGGFLSFQWDILLHEAGFLAIFYAPPAAWTPRSPGWAAPPSRLVSWLLRLLIAKLMFLSGVVKLAGGDRTWWNLTALTAHYETTCLPTWTGWYMHQLPVEVHMASAVGMFAVELIVPALVFGPRLTRAVAAAAFTGFMGFIAATGNYGFFNLLAIVLCIPLLDDRMLPASLRRRAARVFPEVGEQAARSQHGRTAVRPYEPARSWPLLLTLPLAAAIAVLTAIPFARALGIPVQWPAAMARAYDLQAPFHLVNGYGLFARMTTSRPEIVIEGSRDGREWHAYAFRWKPGDVNRRPGFVQPHMPRLDWRMWFAALGTYRTNPWFLAFCRELLQGSPPVLALLETDPFPGEPPVYLRTTLYDYRFTDPAQRRETGAWWRRTPIRPYTPTLFLDPENRELLRALQP